MWPETAKEGQRWDTANAPLFVIRCDENVCREDREITGKGLS